MSSILDRIVARKREELAEAQAATPYRDLEQQLMKAPPVRNFRSALLRPGELRFIAEVKKASPSAGVLREDFDPVAIAQVYEKHGAACISVLTDGPFFQGSLEHLTAVRQAVAVPVLRKDFILDPYQLLQARAAGADAVLLIAEILDDPTLASLLREATALGLHALVEIHEPDNLQRAVRNGARIIGINNRNLQTFETSLQHTLDLCRRLPSSIVLVSESGIRKREDVLRLQYAGVHAVLVGETLMRASDIGMKLDELRGTTAADVA